MLALGEVYCEEGIGYGDGIGFLAIDIYSEGIVIVYGCVENTVLRGCDDALELCISLLGDFY